MIFSIRTVGSDDASHVDCELEIDDFKTVFLLITSLWSAAKYEAQWKEALTAIIDGRVTRCALITDIQNPDESFGVSYWAVFREDLKIIFQERFSRTHSEFLSGPAVLAESYIPVRKQGTEEEHARVSEWEIPIDAVSKFLASD